MPQNSRPRSSILDSLGEEIIKLVSPVSICMLLVVILVSIINANNSSSSTSTISDIIANSDGSNDGSESSWDKFKGALLESLVMVAIVTFATFVLVLLFYYRCTRFLKYYMGYSTFTVLGFLGGEIALVLIDEFRVPVDSITFCVVLFNLAVVGVLAVFMSKMAIFVTQCYLVVIGVLVAYWFTMLPEWTTWVLLVAMSLYDLAAVLLPVGPLRLLVELAISRDEDIPALVYEARPVINNNDLGVRSGGVQRRVWRDRRADNSSSNPNANSLGDASGSASLSCSGASPGSESGIHPATSSNSYIETGLASVEEGRVPEGDAELAPLIEGRMNVQQNQGGSSPSGESSVLEGVGLGLSGAIKLGLGDFVFYSVLVGRAAMYDYMTVYACYLAIIAGLGVTLMLLGLYQKALPALPVSILLGVVFYFLTRLLLEPFIMQCSMNLLLF